MRNKIQATPELLNAMDAIQIFGGTNTPNDTNQQCPCYSICNCTTYPNTCSFQQPYCGVTFPCGGSGTFVTNQCAQN